MATVSSVMSLPVAGCPTKTIVTGASIDSARS